MQEKVRYTKIRKQLTKEQAQEKIIMAQINIQNCQEAIDTWQENKPTGIIACVIESEFGSLEGAIKANKNKIIWCQKRIEDLQRFLV